MKNKGTIIKNTCLQANKIITDLILNHRPSFRPNTKSLNLFIFRSFSTPTEPTIDNPKVSQRVQDIVKINSISLEPSRTLQQFKPPSVNAAIFTDVDTFFQLNNINQLSANKLIRTLASEGRLDDCKRAIERLKERGILPTTPIYTSLIVACGFAKNVFEAFSIYEEMKSKQIMRDIKTYNALMNVCVKTKHLDKALEVLDMLIEDKIAPNKIIYTTLLNGCLKVGQYKKAWEVWDTLKRRDVIKPDEVTYSLMIHACAKRGEVEKAIGLFEEMQSKHLAPTEVTYNSLISACASRKDYYAYAFVYFEMLKKSGFSPDIVSVSSLLHGCEVNGDIKRAETIFQEVTSPRLQNQIDVQLYTQMINVYANGQKWKSTNEYYLENIKKAQQIYDKITELKMELSEHTKIALFRAYTEGRQVELAKQKFLELFPDEKSPIAWTAFIKMYATLGKIREMLEIVEKMRTKGIEFTHYVYKEILIGCSDHLFIKSGMKFLREMHGKGKKAQLRWVKNMYNRCKVDFPDTAKEIERITHRNPDKPKTLKITKDNPLTKMYKELRAPRKGMSKDLENQPI